MKHLLNTLFITTEDAYLSLDGENVVVNREPGKRNHRPISTSYPEQHSVLQLPRSFSCSYGSLR